MSVSSDDRRLAQSVVEWLKSQGSDEGLEVASSCLAEHFGLSEASAAPAGSATLPQIFAAGLAALQKEAQSSSSKSESEDPKFLTFVKALEYKNFFQGATPGSKEYEERLQKARERYTTAMQTKAQQLQQQQEQEQKEQQAKQQAAAALVQRKEKAEEYKTQGNAKVSQKQYEEAIALYTQAIELDGENAIYYANRAAARMYTDDYDEALEDCEKAVEIDPKYVRAYVRLGNALVALNRDEEAIERGYQKALDLDPTNSTAREEIAAAQKRIKDAESAVPAAGGAGGLGGMDFGNMDFASMLKNPALMQMASQMMSQPGMGDMLSGLMGNFMGGAGGASSAPSRAAPAEPASDSATPDLSALSGLLSPEALERIKHNPKFTAALQNPRVGQILEQVKQQGPSALMQHLGDPAISSLIAEVMGSMKK